MEYRLCDNNAILCRQRNQLQLLVDHQKCDNDKLNTDIEKLKKCIEEQAIKLCTNLKIIDEAEEKLEEQKKQNNCLMLEINHLKTVQCQKTELEESQKRLTIQVKQLSELCHTQEIENQQLEKKISQQQVSSLYPLKLSVD